MSQCSTRTFLLPVTVGIDLGNRQSSYCVLSEAKEAVKQGRVTTTWTPVKQLFERLRKRYGVTRVVMEVGAASPWMSRMLSELGFEVVVANPRKLFLISKSSNKTDRRDAELLARLGRVDPKLLSPIQHRGPQARADLAVLRSRSALVEGRTRLINHVRGSVKPWGARLTGCSSGAFQRRVKEKLPEELVDVLAPILEQIEQLTQQIRGYDKRIMHLCDERYPETKLLMQIKGVGPLTALTYVLTIESPERIDKRRNVAAYLGLVPRRDQSGDRDAQLRITKTGDEALRKLLVTCAHYILGPFGVDSDLRRLGERIETAGDKRSKKRAVVAVARKLSIVLLSLWQTGEVYEPLRNAHRCEPAA